MYHRILACIALPLLISACASTAPKFVSAVEAEGVNQVVLGDLVWTGCGNEYEYARSFTAMGADGYEVEGVVCGGLLGPTVYGMGLTPAAFARKLNNDALAIAQRSVTPVDMGPAHAPTLIASRQ